MKNSLLFIILLLIFLPLGAVAAAPLPIYISQVQISGGKDNTAQDFIELFNPNSSAVNLKGYRLVKRPGQAQSDSLIKSFSKDIFVPAKSFFLWANSGYATIAAKPDITTSATISDDTGVGLRFGDSNTGTLIDNIAWGKTSNGFVNVSITNPSANKSLNRKDWYTPASTFFISASNPHNSSTNDLTAAFSGQNLQTNPPPSPKTNPSFSTKIPSFIQATNTSAAGKADVSVSPHYKLETQEAQVLGETTANSPAVSATQTQPTPRKPYEYLILSAAALLVLIFLGYRKFRNKTDKTSLN